MQGETVNVLDTLGSVPDGDFPQMFIEKLVLVMEHSKEEILELLKSKPIAVLKKLRELAFAELVTKLPTYIGREMYARKKDELVAEDIFIFLYSTNNALPDKRLSKCLKPEVDLNATHLTVNDNGSQDIHDTQSLIELVIKLLQKVESLDKKVRSQENRINTLEAKDTCAAIKALVDAPSKRSRDQTEEVVTGQSGKTEPGTQVTPMQSDDDLRLRQPVLQPNVTHTQEVAAGGAPRQPLTITPGAVGAPLNTVSPDGTDGPSPAVQKNGFKISRQDDLTAAKKQTADTGKARAIGGFRLSNQERKNILRGNFQLNAASGQSDIRGTSSGNHRIRSAVQLSHTNKYLVYVGKLAPNTSCDDLRCHLSDFDITNVSDVINLNNNRDRPKEASF